MLRLAITFVLMLEALLGPGMCCCLALGAVASVTPAAARTPDQPAPKRTCCQHKSEPKKTPTPQRKAPTSPCPCKEGQDGDSPRIPAPSTIEHNSLALKLATDIFAAASVLGSPPPAVQETDCVASARSAPFLSPDELLNVLHILRC